MADNEKKVNEIKVEKPKVIKPKQNKKPKLETKSYVLITDVPITTKDGLQILKKGTKKSLTKEGAKYFKKQNYIK